MLFVIRNLTTCIEQNSLKIAIPFDYRNDMNEMCNKQMFDLFFTYMYNVFHLSNMNSPSSFICCYKMIDLLMFLLQVCTC